MDGGARVDSTFRRLLCINTEPRLSFLILAAGDLELLCTAQMNMLQGTHPPCCPNTLDAVLKYHVRYGKRQRSILRAVFPKLVLGPPLFL